MQFKNDFALISQQDTRLLALALPDYTGPPQSFQSHENTGCPSNNNGTY